VDCGLCGHGRTLLVGESAHRVRLAERLREQVRQRQRRRPAAHVPAAVQFLGRLAVE